MAEVLVLGGAGGVGEVACRALATAAEVDTLVVADQEAEAAGALAARLSRTAVGRVRHLGVDVGDPTALRAAMADADLVVNCAGPFYRYGPPTLQAAIEAGVDYLDVCDDLEPTQRMLALDAAARAAGVRALVGMGNSPGVSNLLARLCADTLLDQVESVDIAHVHGGEPDEGAAVIAHRIHAMTHDVPLFVDGAFVTVRQLEPSGRAFEQEVDFRDVGVVRAFPYPHPETVTLPVHLPGLRRVTNLGTIVPLPYFLLTQQLVAAGAAGRRRRRRHGPAAGRAARAARRGRPDRPGRLPAGRGGWHQGRPAAPLRLLAVVARGRRGRGHRRPRGRRCGAHAARAGRRARGAAAGGSGGAGRVPARGLRPARAHLGRRGRRHLAGGAARPPGRHRRRAAGRLSP